MPRLLAGGIPQPQLKTSSRLFVAGYVRTKPFTLWLGDGQNAAGSLDYSLSPSRKTFTLRVPSSDRHITGWLEVDSRDMAGRQVDVLLDGAHVGRFAGGGRYRYEHFGDGHTFVLCPSR